MVLTGKFSLLEMILQSATNFRNPVLWSVLYLASITIGFTIIIIILQKPSRSPEEVRRDCQSTGLQSGNETPVLKIRKIQTMIYGPQLGYSPLLITIILFRLIRLTRFMDMLTFTQ